MRPLRERATTAERQRRGHVAAVAEVLGQRGASPSATASSGRGARSRGASTGNVAQVARLAQQVRLAPAREQRRAHARHRAESLGQPAAGGPARGLQPAGQHRPGARQQPELVPFQVPIDSSTRVPASRPHRRRGGEHGADHGQRADREQAPSRPAGGARCARFVHARVDGRAAPA